jgi:superfamily II DNA or RNA helicase
MELTEKLLVSLGGWPAMKQARAIHEAGRVTEASYEPPVLKGKLSEGGKQFLAGLRMKNSIDIENLCPCRDSRVRGVICAHSMAVGLQVLKPRGSAAVQKEAPRPAAAPRISTEEKPKVRLTLEGSLRHLEAEISFEYATPGAANAMAEAEALHSLMKDGFQDYKGKAALVGEDQVLKFFATSLPKLREKWEIREGERFQHVTKDLVRIDPHFAIREQGDGWLDFHVHYSAGKDAVFSGADLKRLFASGQSHIKLKDGRVALIDGALENEMDEVLRDCNPRQERGGYRVPGLARAYLEASVAEWTGKPSPAQVDASEVPLKAILRPYQTEGAAWLIARARAGRGGLLADEMGLGKTVQALAMVASLSGPVLVVCPSSLVWNWRKEAGHFLPEMPVMTIDGPDRDGKFASIPKARLVVTSYALLRRDIEKYRDFDFAAVILDEAQHIKNPDSQNAKAAYALRASSRFILTGTPIENSLRDLWSLYEFLLPGYLGSRQDFKDRYETPLLNGERGSLWQRLNRRLQPYLLRRRKKEILKDLPDKIEQVIEVELSDEQKAAYTQLQLAARAQIDELRDQGGAAKMKVLTALLRLRQACCDLRLLGAESGASAKLTALRELIEEAIDGGHRVLVFSQFTSMLDLISEELGDIAHCRLDGSTRNREEVVQRFQTDASVPVFLISLKAGGVGLNLTAADTVIHFDPWWNPAIEAQATDRAHRIGQKNVVTSIKLIARDTVEERVLRMQEKKRELMDGALDGEAALQGLSTEELAEMVG